MKCIQCGTENQEDNKYCKECGAKLIPPQTVIGPEQLSMPGMPIEDRTSEIKGLLQLAVSQLDSEDYEGALKNTIRATQLDPNNLLALQLLVTLYEHLGDYDAAIEQQRRIVELYPTAVSEKDVLKRLESNKQNAWIAGIINHFREWIQKCSPQTLAAIAAGAFVLLLGLGLFLSHRPSSPQSAAKPEAVPSYPSRVQEETPNYAAPTTQGTAQLGQGLIWQQSTPRPNQAQRVNPMSPGQRQAAKPLNPVTPISGPQTEVTVPKIPPANVTLLPPASASKGVTSAPQATAPTPRSSTPPLYTTRDQYGNTVITNRPNAENTRQQTSPQWPQQLRRSTTTGNSESGMSHQRLAMNYKNNGQYQQARTELNRAISAYQAQIQAGRNTAAANAGIDSCRRALETLP